MVACFEPMGSFPLTRVLPTRFREAFPIREVEIGGNPKETNEGNQCQEEINKDTSKERR